MRTVFNTNGAGTVNQSRVKTTTVQCIQPGSGGVWCSSKPVVEKVYGRFTMWRKGLCRIVSPLHWYACCNARQHKLGWTQILSLCSRVWSQKCLMFCSLIQQAMQGPSITLWNELIIDTMFESYHLCSGTSELQTPWSIRNREVFSIQGVHPVIWRLFPCSCHMPCVREALKRRWRDRKG